MKTSLSDGYHLPFFRRFGISTFASAKSLLIPKAQPTSPSSSSSILSNFIDPTSSRPTQVYILHVQHEHR